MWFKLAGATFTNNLGTMDSISKSYMMDYSGLTGLSASPGSVSYATDSTPDATITFTVKSGYVFKSGSKVTASGGASKTYTASADIAAGSSFTMALTGISNKVTFVGAAELVSGGNTGGSEGNEPDTPVNPPSEPEVPDTPTGSTVFDFDFVNYKLTDYADQGIFTVPDTSTIDAITYDSSKGANLNKNLPYGLTLTNPIDASRPWTLEFTGTFATPTDLTGNRRALLTGGNDLTPFVVINGNGGADKFGFQISTGNHTWVGIGSLLYDQEVTYKIVHDGNNSTTVYQNGTQIGTSSCVWTGKTFGTILGVIKGKSTAYTWQDVETGKKSYLKNIKFYYN